MTKKYRLKTQIKIRTIGVLLFVSLSFFSINSYASKQDIDLNLIGAYGGTYNDIKLSGDYVYCATVNGLDIFDITDPSSPQLKGHFLTQTSVLKLFVVNTTVYLAGGDSGLLIVDADNPSSPVLLSQYNEKSVNAVYVRGDNAFVATNSGFLIFDVSDPASISIKGSLSEVGGGNIAVSGDRAYVVNGVVNDGFAIVDISNPFNPVLTGTYKPVIPWLERIRIVGIQAEENFVYLAETGTHHNNGLIIVDTSEPSNPQRIGYFKSPDNPVNLSLSGKTIYLFNYFAETLVLDVTEPTSPQFAGSFKTPGNARAIDISTPYAYVADGNSGLAILKLENIVPPKLLSSFDVFGATYDVFTKDNIAYLTAEKAGLIILDVTNPSTPEFISSYDTHGSAKAVYVSGNIAYLAVGNNGLTIVDITDPPSPALLGTLDLNADVQSVFVEGNTAYLLSPYEGSGLYTVDVSDPSTPLLSGFYETPGNAFGIYVLNSIAYIADGKGGLSIADTSNPASPSFLGYFKENTKRVFVEGNIAYAASGSGSDLFIIDVSDPASPTVISSLEIEQGDKDIYVSASKAYITTRNGNLFIVDISDLSSPAVLSTLEIASRFIPNAVSVSGNKAYISAGGFSIIDVADSANPLLIGKYDTAGSIRTIAINENVVYVAQKNSNLKILDISSPEKPQLKKTINNNYGDINQLFISNNLLYFGYVEHKPDSQGNLVWHNRLGIFDITEPLSPVFTGSYEVSSSTTGHNRDEISQIFISGNYAYLVGSQKAGFIIIDVTNPSSPQFSGRLGVKKTGYSDKVFIEDDRAYLIGDNHFCIFDLSNPASPKLINKFKNKYPAIDIYVSENIAYVTLTNGIETIDLSNPKKPKLLNVFHTLSFPPYNNKGVNKSIVSGDTAFIINSNRLFIVDVSNPASPFLKSSAFESKSVYYSVALSGQNIVVNRPEGISIFDPIDTSAPTLVSSFSSAGDATDVALSGNTAYIAGSGGLSIVDINNPSFIKFKGEFKTINNPNIVAVQGSYVFLGVEKEGLFIIDAKNPSSPQLLSKYTKLHIISDIKIKGSTIFLSGGELHIIDIKNPKSPKLLKIYKPAGGVDKIFIDGKQLYFLTGFNKTGIINIKNPSSPTRSGTIKAPAITLPAPFYDTTFRASSIFVSDKRAYTLYNANDDDDDFSVIAVFDVSNPTSTKLLGSYTYFGNYASLAGDIFSSNKFVFATYFDFDGNFYNTTILQAINFKNPSKPELITDFTTSSIWSEFQVIDNNIFLTSNTQGLRIFELPDSIDITPPENTKKPDLKVMTFKYPKITERGSRAKAKAIIKNVGKRNALNLYINIYSSLNSLNDASGDTLLKSKSIKRVKVKKRKTIYFKWKVDDSKTPGNYYLKVTCENAKQDPNLDNNIKVSKDSIAIR